MLVCYTNHACLIPVMQPIQNQLVKSNLKSKLKLLDRTIVTPVHAPKRSLDCICSCPVSALVLSRATGY